MGEQTPDVGVSAARFDRMLEALANRQRRTILVMLQRGETVSESGLHVRDASAAERVASSVRQRHLPKLADAGFIEWDRESGDVAKGPRYGEIEPVLELMETHADELPPGWL